MADHYASCMPLMVVLFTLCPGFHTQYNNADSLNVQADFDFAKYMGKWYVLSWYSDITVPSGSSLTDYTQHYVQTGEGNATVYAQGRNPEKPTQCQYYANFLSTTDTPGKLLHTADGSNAPYWVLETDYTQYAFVYGCSKDSSGTCYEEQAWILSRTPNLPDSVKDKASNFYRDICIPETCFETIAHTEECNLRTHWKLRNDQDCTVSTFDVQENFDINRYAGKWYETRWLAPFSIPGYQLFQDYQHHYVITGDGNVTAYINGRSPDDPDQCFYYDASIKRTSSAGKLLFKSKDNVTIPYWVMRTDYTQYAVVYGCYNESLDGSCYQARSWVWSRTPTLPQHLQYEANTYLQNICVNPAAFLDTQQTEECISRTHWKLRNDQDCTVSTFDVQENFDINKYAGKWYETRWLAPFSIPGYQLFQDYQHHYVITGDGNVTAYINGRSPDDPDQCFYYDASIKRTSSAGKLLFKSKDNVTIPYWVMRTDYTQYAVVYGCYNESLDGSCYQARSWVWSRTPTLPQHLQYEANTYLQNICVNPAAFLDTQQTEECISRTHWKLRNDQDCTVSTFDVQENFDINKYAGKWYETRWLAPFSIPANQLFQDYQHHYVITGDGNVTAYINGRSPDDPDQCFYYDASIKRTSSAGKLLFKSKDNVTIPYWVMRTDYTQYAVVYGCYNESLDGSCYQARSWVWSRTPNLPQHLQYEANTYLQNICVNPAAFLDTQQTEVCPLKPTWNLNEKMDCSVSNFKVKPNFDIDKFTSLWFEISRLPKEYQSQTELPTDRAEELYLNAKGELNSYIRERFGDTCKYKGIVYEKTDVPGKFMTDQFSEEIYEYWVADTDYKNYAVMYGCERVGSDGGCLSARGSVWSRRSTLPPQIQYYVNSVLQGLCINPSALVTTVQNREFCCGRSCHRKPSHDSKAVFHKHDHKDGPIWGRLDTRCFS